MPTFKQFEDEYALNGALSILNRAVPNESLSDEQMIAVRNRIDAIENVFDENGNPRADVLLPIIEEVSGYQLAGRRDEFESYFNEGANAYRLRFDNGSGNLPVPPTEPYYGQALFEQGQAPMYYVDRNALEANASSVRGFFVPDRKHQRPTRELAAQQMINVVNAERRSLETPAFDPEFTDTFTYYGWFGGEHEGTGLRDALGGLVSPEDAEKLQTIFEGQEVDSADVDYMVDMIREFRNRGYNLEIANPVRGNDGSIAQNVNVRVSGNGLARTTVRLYETGENRYYRGRVATPANIYYWDPKEMVGTTIRGRLAESFAPSVEDSIRLFDVATGAIATPLTSTKSTNRNGKISEEATKYNVTNKQAFSTNYRFNDVTTTATMANGQTIEMSIISKANGNYYGNVSFNKVEKADTYIKDQIEIAERAYRQALNFDKMVESSELMVRAQEVARDQSKTNNQQKEARAAQEAIYRELEVTIDPRFEASQRLLFDDMVALQRYQLDPSSVELTFDSIEDEEMRANLVRLAKDIQNGSSVEDLTLNDLQEAFMASNFGSYETGFNPGIVSQLGQSSGRNALSRALMSAMKISGYDTSKLRGNDYLVDGIKDQMIAFDDVSGRALEDVLVDDPDMENRQTRAMVQVRDRLDAAGYGGENTTVQIDEHGVIHYEYDRESKFGVDRIKHDIGQVFNDDELGVIITDFGSGNNFGFIPGYEGFVIPGESFDTMTRDNLVERTRLRGFDQVLASSIDLQMTNQLQAPWQGGDVQNVADDMGGSCLNKIYRSQMNGFKVPLDYVERSFKTDNQLWADIQTERRRVRFPNSYGDSAGTNFEQNLQRDGFNESKMIQENLRVIGPNWENIFDPYMMGSGKNQGIERYLVEDAQVDADMKIIPSKGWVDPSDGQLKPDRTPLTKELEFVGIDHMPADRQMMATKQHLVAHYITGGEEHGEDGIALMQFGGWTYDDSYVVSKKFADKYMVPDAHTGELRPLRRGDKLSDFGSNKGVIALVVDPDMPEEEARAKDLEKEVAFFRENPLLDVVGGPYAALSRNNMAVSRELRQHGVEDLYNPITGETLEGAIGFAPMMVTDMTVDKKSHVYDKDDLAKGKGRSISTMLLLNLQVMGADNIINEVYGNNVAAWSDLREYAIAFGADIDRDGNMHVGFTPQDDEQRNHYSIDVRTDYDYSDKKVDMAKSQEIEESANDFLQRISDHGGFLELPFPLINKEMSAELLKNNNAAGEPTIGSYARRAIAQDEKGNYAISILSGALRRGTTMADGATRMSDITDKYVRIYKRACDYMIADARLKELEADIASGSIKKEDVQTQLDELKNDKAVAHRYAQYTYDDIHTEIAPKLDGPGPNGKHSLIRDKITSKMVADSATLVASPDPRLNVNQIAISQETADKMGINEGELVMGWRDPTWRTGAVRAFEIKIDNDVTGFAMAPNMDKSHDGDFDGDSYGFKVLHSPEAQEDLRRLMSHQANMLNKGDGVVKDADGKPLLNKAGEPMYPIFVNDGMDMASTSAACKAAGKPDPERLRQKAFELANGTPEEQEQLYNVLNQYNKEAFRSDEAFATDYINLTNSQTVMTSLARIVDHGAKGSPAALLECAKYEGAEITGIKLYDGYNGKDAENAKDIELIKQYIDIAAKGGLVPMDNPEATAPFAGIKDRNDVQYATGTKSDNTARPGATQQKATAAGRNHGLAEIMEIFYKPTQMTLQIKHDAKQAKEINDEFDFDGKINMLLIQGRDPENPREKVGSLSKKSFVRQVDAEFEKLGLDYTPEHLDKLADVLANQNGYIRSLDQVFKEDASYFNKLSYGGKKNGGVKALMQGAHEGACLFQGEDDIDRKVVPTAIREKTQIMARHDVLAKERMVLKDVDSKLTDLETTFIPKTQEPTVSMSVEPSAEPVSKKPEGMRTLNEALADMKRDDRSIDTGVDYGPNV